METKTCRRCELDKPLQAFGTQTYTRKKDGQRVTVPLSTCRECAKTRQTPPKNCQRCGVEYKSSRKHRRDICPACLEEVAWCSGHKEYINRSEFPGYGNGKQKDSGYCLKCIQVARKIRMYGVTPEEFNKRFRAQNGACAICKEVSSELLNIDHDHTTGEVRGLLCRGCNTGIGLLKDSVVILQEAIKYLS